MPEIPFVSLTGKINDTKKADLFSLMLLSVDIKHRVLRGSNGWEIMVLQNDFLTASRELSSFEAENRNWPPPKEKPAAVSGPSPLTFLYMAMLAYFFSITGPWDHSSDWFRAGALVPYRIFEKGEWWRVVTALTLHADIVHLVGNMALGTLMISYLALQTGPGIAWGMTLLSGTAGNFINAYFHETHQSIGFSTAVFGVIGVLCGIKITKKDIGIKGLILPMGAGFGLLALLGTEGERTDLGAHLWGLASGLFCGFAWSKFRLFSLALPRWIQPVSGALVFIIIYMAWNTAGTLPSK